MHFHGLIGTLYASLISSVQLANHVPVHRFAKHVDFDGKTCSDGRLFSDSIPSVIGCVMLCLLKKTSCVSVFYKESDLTCVGCSTYAHEESLLQDDPGTSYFYKVYGDDTWVEHQGSYYYFNLAGDQNLWRSHRDSQTECQIWGGYLAEIKSESEQAFINRTIVARNARKKSIMWMGGEWINGIWQWRNGDSIEHPLWHTGQPDNMGIDTCIHLVVFRDNRWSDGQCNGDLGLYVCQKNQP